QLVVHIREQAVALELGAPHALAIELIAAAADLRALDDPVRVLRADAREAGQSRRIEHIARLERLCRSVRDEMRARERSVANDAAEGLVARDRVLVTHPLDRKSTRLHSSH